MSEHRANIVWKRSTSDFVYDHYNRDHVWDFGDGVRVEASAAPDFLGTPERVDPEEALVVALSSCHMLTFLAIAARKRLTVDAYEDAAVGTLEKNAQGKLAVTRVVLRPVVQFGKGTELSSEQLQKLHDTAHAQCFIANSVLTKVEIRYDG